MMIPLYFPYTYISEQVADALTLCFEKTAFYSATDTCIPLYLVPFINKNALDLRTPVKGDEDKIESIIKEYKFLGNHNQINKMDYYKTNPYGIPFFNDSSAYHIKSNITDYMNKKNTQSSETLDENKQHVNNLKARLFLQLAHEYDQENIEIESHLSDFQKKENEIFKNLNGMNKNNSYHKLKKKINLHPDTDTKNIENRLSAWLQLYYQDTAENTVFITINKYVIEYLSSCSEELELIHETEKFSYLPENHVSKLLFQKYLKEVIQNLIKGYKCKALSNISGQNDLNKIFLKFYRVREESPNDFFTKCYANKFFIHGKKNKNKNFLFVLIDY